MIDPATVCLFIPGHLKKFKLDLFNRIGDKIKAAGGRIVRAEFAALDRLPDNIIPIVGCTPELRPFIDNWRKTGRQWIYWDRGYARRVFATDLPTGDNGGYYRWHVGSFQMQAVRDVSGDRWSALKTEVSPWARTGRHIVVAEPSETYERFHGIEGWTRQTVKRLNELTDRPLKIRNKEMQRFGRKLHEDLKGAHCLVTHGSNAAVEAVIMGCPVFVHQDSAAALVGRCDLGRIDEPYYPDRQPWLNSLACCQFSERELVDGTLWKMIE
ncbi:hypothetical protein [Mesorhizobium sp.]|uniref:hypothetical protein n=1 Tax=Mesorhizobium sp. TaxID=1871066 RepID=UPI000FE57453|nr:hypothetical protein [Mesorhizobium sp.]RWN33441.1 MAG: hypothetical protein EOR95_15960 [Mesorhizobium sp.]